MDISRVSRNDWIIGGGFVLMFIGTVAPWYGVDLGFASVTANGWHGSYLGWLTFILCLAAALVVFRHVVADVAIALPVPDAVIAVACGGVSALIVVIRIFTKPQFTGLRWGIFVSLVGALVVAVAGFLKYGEVGTPAAATVAAPPPPAGQSVTPPPPAMPAPPAAPAQAAPPPPAPTMPSPPAAPVPAAEGGAPAVEQGAAASLSRFCIKCGNAFPSAEARFCAKCGAPRQEA